MRNALVEIPTCQRSIWVRLNNAGNAAYREHQVTKGVVFPAPLNRDGRLKLSLIDIICIFGPMMRDGLNPFSESTVGVDLPI